uniref:Dehydrogenase/reductase 2 n=1 Tax=Pseudonaja textilis TaxID=8673 RepID=A0A670ZYN9_PSETE
GLQDPSPSYYYRVKYHIYCTCEFAFHSIFSFFFFLPPASSLPFFFLSFFLSFISSSFLLPFSFLSFFSFASPSSFPPSSFLPFSFLPPPSLPSIFPLLLPSLLAPSLFLPSIFYSSLLPLLSSSLLSSSFHFSFIFFLLPLLPPSFSLPFTLPPSSFHFSLIPSYLSFLPSFHFSFLPSFHSIPIPSLPSHKKAAQPHIDECKDISPISWRGSQFVQELSQGGDGHPPLRGSPTHPRATASQGVVEIARGTLAVLTASSACCSSGLGHQGAPATSPLVALQPGPAPTHPFCSPAPLQRCKRGRSEISGCSQIGALQAELRGIQKEALRGGGHAKSAAHRPLCLESLCQDEQRPGRPLPGRESGPGDGLHRRAMERYGGIDILVCNAAVNPFFGNMLDASEEVWDKILDINVKATALLINLVAPHMQKRGNGSIVIVSSVAGYMPFPNIGPYNVSKTALLGLTRNLAIELAPHIRVNCVAPGLIRTKFSAPFWQDENMENRALEVMRIWR